MRAAEVTPQAHVPAAASVFYDFVQYILSNVNEFR